MIKIYLPLGVFPEASLLMANFLVSSPLMPPPSEITESYGMVPGPSGWNPGMTTAPYFMPEDTNTFIDLSEQDWWDPLGALDFSNFAQAGSADSTTGFGFY